MNDSAFLRPDEKLMVKYEKVRKAQGEERKLVQVGDKGIVYYHVLEPIAASSSGSTSPPGEVNEAKGESQAREPEWSCDVCNTSNWSRRTKCRTMCPVYWDPQK